MAPDKEHAHHHGRGGDHDHGHQAPGDHAPGTGGGSGLAAGGGPPRTDRDKLAQLVRHWITHNDGHRESYLEWREKLAGENLPRTHAALGFIADLTEEMNQQLRDALDELESS